MKQVQRLGINVQLRGKLEDVEPRVIDALKQYCHSKVRS